MLEILVLSTLDNIFRSDGFVIGYYVFTVAMSLLLIKETKRRIYDLKKGIRSIVYAPAAFGIMIAYLFLIYPHVKDIPILNWSWLGYNIAFGPFVNEGLWGIVPFVPLLIYMFIHINYVEEFYFRKSNKMVLLWAAAHVIMGIMVHMAIMLIPIGFLFKYIHDKKGLEGAYAMHFATNIMVVAALLFTLL